MKYFLYIFLMLISRSAITGHPHTKPEGLNGESVLGEYTYQAEEAYPEGEADSSSEHSGYSGSGYMEFPSGSGSLEFRDVDGGSGGPAVLLIRYSLWMAETTVNLRINGTPMEIYFRGTSGWNRWRNFSRQVDLLPGKSNTIRIEPMNQKMGKLDAMVVIPSGAEDFMHLSESFVKFISRAETPVNVSICSNQAWEIIETPGWLNCDPLAGQSFTTLRMTTGSANNTHSSRLGRVVIRGEDDILHEINVEQTGHIQGTYYIDAIEGKDASDGRTVSGAWQSLNKINNRFFGPGDSILFRGGNQWFGTLILQGSGSEEQPLVVGRYGPGTEKPEINADGNEEAILLKNMEYVVVENLSITNPSETTFRTARGIRVFADQDREFHEIMIRNNEIYQVIGWVRQNRRYSSSAIYIDTEGDYAHFTDLTIEGNYIHECTTRGITANAAATNWLDTNYMHNRVVIRNNRLDNTGCDAIRSVASKNVIVANNTVYRTGNYTLGEEARYIAACFPQQCGNTTWQFNEVAYTAPTSPPQGDMDSQAFDVDNNCTGTHIFQYNYTHDNAGGFLLFMGDIVENSKLGPFREAVIRYNISQNDGTSFPRLFELHDFKGKKFSIQVYNNIFYYGVDTIKIQLKGGDHNGIYFANNIFHAPAGDYPDCIGMENNLFYGHEGAEVDRYAVNLDPYLSDPGSGREGFNTVSGYRIGKESPCRGKGIIMQDNGGRDFWGNPVPLNLKPDIGVHQINEQ